MSRNEFFQRILTQLGEIQSALNTLRATVKEEIQENHAPALDKEERRNFS